MGFVWRGLYFIFDGFVFLISDIRLQVKADVTEGSEKLVEAIGDAEAVICATGFRYSWDLFAPWKVLLLCLFSSFLFFSSLAIMNWLVSATDTLLWIVLQICFI